MSDRPTEITHAVELAARYQEAARDFNLGNVFDASMVILLSAAAQLAEALTEEEFVKKCQGGFRLAARKRAEKKARIDT